MECKSKNREVEYWGETGRDCYSRGGEHIKGFVERKEDNPMWKHVWEEHKGEGEIDMFEMKMEKGYKKPLARQIREGAEIETSTNILMNSKAEWNNARIPRIIIEEGEVQREDVTSGLGRQKDFEKKTKINTRETREKQRKGETESLN